MAHLSDRRNRWHVLLGMILAIGLLGCSSPPRQGTGPKPPVVPAEPTEAAAQSEKIILSLELEPGTKTHYRVTAEAVTTVEGPETALQTNTSTAPFAKVSETSEVAFTQEILGPASGDSNAVAALVTIDQVRYVRRSSGQADLAFDSQKPADQKSPFARLIGQTYTIEIHPLGYVTGTFNLRPARLAVRGPSPAHAAALDLVSPPAIFLRHGYFSLPGPDVGSLAVGGLAVVVFAGSPRPKRTTDGGLAEVPFLSCSYVGGAEFNLDAGRVEGCLEHMEVRMPLPASGSPSVEDPEGRIIVATRYRSVQRLALD